MIRDPFQSSQAMIAASILSANFARLGQDIDEVLDLGADFLHLDILDGHFAPNISFGPHVIEGVRQIVGERCYLDAHLMTSNPLEWAGPMVKAGADNITFHIEAVDDPIETAREIRKLGCHVGITLRPMTAIESIYPVLDDVDVVLIMSVKPGFSGQRFMPDMLEKVRELKPRMKPGHRIQIDGGINAETAGPSREAGVDWFVVASAIFDASDRRNAVRDIRERLDRH